MISTVPLLTGLSMTLLCIAWATVLLPLNRLPLAVRLAVIVIITLLVMLTVSDLPGWYYVRGTFGDSSITALFFYTAFILQQNFSRQLCQEKELLLLRRLILATAVLIYPFALGLTSFDSYSLGFAGPWLLVVLLLLTLFCWYRKYYFLAMTITAAVVSCRLQLLESVNLLDYLIDPALLVIVALTWLRPSVKGAGLAENYKH